MFSFFGLKAMLWEYVETIDVKQQIAIAANPAAIATLPICLRTYTQKKISTWC